MGKLHNPLTIAIVVKIIVLKVNVLLHPHYKSNLLKIWKFSNIKNINSMPCPGFKLHNNGNGYDCTHTPISTILNLDLSCANVLFVVCHLTVRPFNILLMRTKMFISVLGKKLLCVICND